MAKENRSWKVKILRPEEIFSSPIVYYNEEEAERYEKSNSIRKVQIYHTSKLIELIGIEPPKRVIDLGCGTGFSTEFLSNLGFKVVGIDISLHMLKFARRKNLKVILGDFRELKRYFRRECFDLVISVSAIQWIKEREDMKKVCEGIYHILKNKGVAGIQFYPYSLEELNKWIRIFRRSFSVKPIVENEENPRKRNVYLVLEKL